MPGISHAPLLLGATSESTFLSLVGQVLTLTGLDSALSGKQGTLPSGTPGQYLHLNADTGAVEWAESGGSGVPGISSTNYATFANSLDMSFESSHAFVRFTLPSGEVSAYFNMTSQPVAGEANDMFFQIQADSSSGYAYLEGYESAGLIVGTSAGPILFRVGRGNTVATVSVSGLQLNTIPTSDQNDGVTVWCDTTSSNVLKLSSAPS